MLKAAILSAINQVHIIDISHEIDKFNIIQAAYVFGNAFANFPKGSIHVLGIKAGNDKNERYFALKLEDQFILCPDNGIISLLNEQGKPNTLKELPVSPKEKSLFFVRDILVPEACKLAIDLAYFESLPNAINPKQILSYHPTSNDFSITGRCIYIDSYGNVITNITKDFFERCRNGRAFTIFLPGKKITKICLNYNDVSEIDPVALFNSAGHLEIAINKGQAKQLLFPRNFNSHTDFNITIEFS